MILSEFQIAVYHPDETVRLDACSENEARPTQVRLTDLFGIVESNGSNSGGGR